MKEFLEIVTHPVMLPISIALLAGAAAYVLSRAVPAACRLIALAGSAAVLWVVARTAMVGAAPLGWEWTKLTDSIALSVDLSTSKLGMLVAGASAAFAVLITIYSFRAMAGRYWEGKFYAYLLWALGGACIVALAGNLLVLLVGWEIVTLMLYLMINQGRADAKAGAAKAYGMLGFADACLLLAIVLLMVMQGGSKNLSLTAGPRVVSELGATGYLIYLLLMVAALAKAGAIPLHSWIPAIAADAPTPVMAYLPAALDKLLGIYLLAVVALRMFRPDPAMGTVMMIVGAVTILAAVLMAMMQHSLKKLLSFHAVSQVGYMVLGIGTGTAIGVVGGLFHMLNHAIYKSSLFMMSGTVERAAGTDEMADMGGLAKALPVTFVCGLVAAAAISGVPPLNGFVSKWLVYQGALQISNRPLAVALVVVAVFGSALTLASFVKVMYSAFLSPAPNRPGTPRPQVRESFAMAAPMVVLAIACVLLGVLPGIVVEPVFAPVAARALPGQEVPVFTFAGAQTETGAWNPAQATGLILIGLALGWVFALVAKGGMKVRMVRPFLGGEVPGPGDDRFRVPGTHFYETIGKLPIIGRLLREGESSAFDLYYWSGKHGHTLVEVLRAQHTGLLSLYVAWGVLGLIATMVYLLTTMG